jgi:hypothetical protein
MKRTQIYLEEDLHRDLHEAARREGRSGASLIREALRHYLTQLGQRPPGGLMRLRGMGKEIWADEDAGAYVDRLRSEWR